MANRSRGDRRQPVRAVPSRQAPAFSSEPPVRRWPHPVEGMEPMQTGDPALHYIRCALSYQNQLLAEIRTLVEKLAGAAPEEEK